MVSFGVIKPRELTWQLNACLFVSVGFLFDSRLFIQTSATIFFDFTKITPLNNIFKW